MIVKGVIYINSLEYKLLDGASFYIYVFFVGFCCVEPKRTFKRIVLVLKMVQNADIWISKLRFQTRDAILEVTQCTTCIIVDPFLRNVSLSLKPHTLTTLTRSTHILLLIWGDTLHDLLDKQNPK